MKASIDGDCRCCRRKAIIPLLPGSRNSDICRERMPWPVGGEWREEHYCRWESYGKGTGHVHEAELSLAGLPCHHTNAVIGCPGNVALLTCGRHAIQQRELQSFLYPRYTARRCGPRSAPLLGLTTHVCCWIDGLSTACLGDVSGIRVGAIRTNYSDRYHGFFLCLKATLI